MSAILSNSPGAYAMRAPRLRHWRFQCVGIGLALLFGVLSGIASATESTIDAALAAYEAGQSSSKAFLSGVVYFDVDKDGTPEPATDWGIYQAVVQIYNAADPNTVVAQTKASSTGEYYFVVDPGTYIIKNLTQSGLGSTTSVGGVKLDSGLGFDPKGTLSSTRDTVDGITVAAGQEGFNYNFGEYSYPLSALSKRLLLSSVVTTNPGGGTIDPVTPIREVPEPGTLALLVVGLGFALYRVRKSK